MLKCRSLKVLDKQMQGAVYQYIDIPLLASACRALSTTCTSTKCNWTG